MEKSSGKEITQDQLNKIVEQVATEFLEKNRDKIVKEAHKRVRALRGA